MLILSELEDQTACRVRAALEDRGTCCTQWDVGDFPQRLLLAASTGHGSTGHGSTGHGSTGYGSTWAGRLGDSAETLRLEDIEAVYYRRPSEFRLPDGLSDEHRRFALAEARAGFGGLLVSLPARWVNHPSRIADAEFKPAQLRVAADVGFRVPRTLLTNDATAAREFAAAVGGKLVYKPLSGGGILDGAELKLIYANMVDSDQLFDEEISVTANLFQEPVPKRYDVRVTVVGEHCFATIVHAGSEAATMDWRSDYPSLTYEPVDVPERVSTAIATYLRRFGLSFGAFDFAVTPDDEWWFLECNPNGQWGWVEEETGLPIASALAALLDGGSVH